MTAYLRRSNLVRQDRISQLNKNIVFAAVIEISGKNSLLAKIGRK